MHIADSFQFAWSAVRGARVRSLLMMLAMSIGVAAVIVLTALGEGARNYVTGEFASLGTNLVIVLPGRNETGGAGVAMSVSGTPRDLTLDDARALQRNTRVRRMAPINVGTTLLNAGGLERDVPVLGSSHELLTIRNWSMAQGKFLPEKIWIVRTRSALLAPRCAKNCLAASRPLDSGCGWVTGGCV